MLLTVSGPGAVHGIAGLSNAQVNCWPMVMLSGSAEQHELGKGSFQELDQVAAAAPYCKYAGRATTPAAIPAVVEAAVASAVTGRPGAAYVDVPSDVLMATNVAGVRLPSPGGRGGRATAADGCIGKALQMLRGAQRCERLCVGCGLLWGVACRVCVWCGLLLDVACRMCVLLWQPCKARANTCDSTTPRLRRRHHAALKPHHTVHRPPHIVADTQAAAGVW